VTRDRTAIPHAVAPPPRTRVPIPEQELDPPTSATEAVGPGVRSRRPAMGRKGTSSAWPSSSTSGADDRPHAKEEIRRPPRQRRRPGPSTGELVSEEEPHPVSPSRSCSTRHRHALACRGLGRSREEEQRTDGV
jgi:hypothetical protein